MTLSSLLTSTVIIPFVAAQVQHFYSNPVLAPPTFVVETNNFALTDKGYIFVSPFQDAQPSPLIYDSNGTLIWDGAALVTPHNAHDFTVCEYNQVPHLCFVDAVQENGYARGSGLFLDNTYTPVLTVTSGNNQPELDQHEFFVKENGNTVLVTIYKQIPFDASPWGIANVSWLSIGIFQEIDLYNLKVLFEWQTIDHVQVNQSFVLPGTTDISGNGSSAATAWDYFHINSVDKDANGDYLVSGRHVKTIYKVSGKDGSIIWQLGGKSSDFTMDYEFNFQHNARFRDNDSTTTTTTISLYDNGSDDSPPPAGQAQAGYGAYSSGIVAVVDHTTMNSTLLERYISPGHQLSDSQGDLQFLPNGNKFMGMGAIPVAVEFTDNSTGNGEVVFYGHMANDGSIVQSYRNYKFPWSAQPSSSPDLFVYAETCDATPVYYASWNGATEVAQWTFVHGSGTSSNFSTVGTVPKAGFETNATFPGTSLNTYSIAMALDANGNVLSISAPTLAFVPASSVTGCTAENCGPTLDYTTAANQTCTTLSKRRQMHHWDRPSRLKSFAA